MVDLVRDLAEYERLEHEYEMTPDQLHAALFGPEPALFGHVAEVDGEVVGFTLWFLSFSTFRGTHGIYLEDLFVRPAHRGSGLGRALLTELAEECVRRGYARLEWSVLDGMFPRSASTSYWRRTTRRVDGVPPHRRGPDDPGQQGSSPAR